MRASIVPAQMTTVEDKIAGNLSLQQAALIGMPVMFGFLSAALLPPSGKLVPYKIAMIAIVFIVCAPLAIRVRGVIVARWLIIFAKYCRRPRYYVFDKNSLYLRSDSHLDIATVEPEVVNNQKAEKFRPQSESLSPADFAKLEQLAKDPRAGMKFLVGKRGELNVQITEVK